MVRIEHARGVADLRGGLDPVHPRHPHVHQDDVGSQLAGEPDGLRAVPGLPHDLDPLDGAEEEPEPSADQVLVVGDQDPDHGIGRVAATR